MSSPIRAEEHAIMKRIVLMTAAVVAVSGLCANVTGVLAQDAPAGDAAAGKRVYIADGCFTCHGRAGQGGAYNGPAPLLAKTALPFEGLKMQIRNPSNDMPAYSEAVMSDQQIADIFAFLQSLPARRDPKDIAILKD
jgi:mono/diheme cytochrome c family protein